MRDSRIAHLEELVDAHIRHIESLKSELKELKEALFWYADGNGACESPPGEYARKALIGGK